MKSISQFTKKKKKNIQPETEHTNSKLGWGYEEESAIGIIYKMKSKLW